MDKIPLYQGARASVSNDDSIDVFENVSRNIRDIANHRKEITSGSSR